MNINTYYQLRFNPHELPGAIKLRFREWELLLGLNDERTLAEAGKQLGLGEEETRRILSKFLEKELIEIAEMNYGEYLKRKQRAPVHHSPASTASSSKASIEAHAVVPLPEARQEARTAVPVPPLPSTPEPRFAPLPLPLVGASESNSSAAVSVSVRKLSIKSLTSFIMQHAGGDSNAGQLMVYRVFMRVDTKLLKRNGITSLRFQEDRLVADPELEQALLDSVAIALGVTCPEHVFIAA
jgi:hypothetical protein